MEVNILFFGCGRGIKSGRVEVEVPRGCFTKVLLECWGYLKCMLGVFQYWLSGHLHNTTFKPFLLHRLKGVSPYFLVAMVLLLPSLNPQPGVSDPGNIQGVPRTNNYLLTSWGFFYTPSISVDPYIYILRRKLIMILKSHWSMVVIPLRNYFPNILKILFSNPHILVKS